MSPATAEFSILFPDPQTRVELVGHSSAEDLADLNLDQVFESMVRDRAEYELDPLLRTLLADEESVRYRQAVYRDLAVGALAPIQSFAMEMRTTRRHLKASQRSRRYESASWFLESAKVYCGSVTALADALHSPQFTSAGLRRCWEYLQGYLESDGFQKLRAETGRLYEQLHGLRYCVLVDGARVTVGNFGGEPDYSAQVLSTFEKFQTGDVPSRLVEFRHEFQNHIQEMIVDRIAVLHPDLFHPLVTFQKTYADLVDPVLSRFDREVQLYLAYLELLRPLQDSGLPFTEPVVSRHNKSIVARETFDLALALKLTPDGRSMVLNDLELKGEERIAVLSGPNQGGKTTYARTVGQLHYLASLGFPVPGTSASLCLCDAVVTHFGRQEVVEDLQSGLEAELLRVREMLARTTPRTVVIMNESFASTTTDDQLLLGTEVIARLIELDAFAVYVTFIDELSRLGPTVVSLTSTVHPERPAERTFRIVRRPADGRAYAMVLAEAQGLNYESIANRLRQ
ncbi:MAG: MutS-related protein [Candidatus Dormibacteria bacterium]